MKVPDWLTGRVRQPIDVPQTLRALAMLMFSMSSVIAVAVVYDGKVQQDHRADRAENALAQQAGIDTCRAQVSSAVQDGTTTYLFALGHRAGAQDQLVIALALKRPIAPAIADLDAARQRLDEAGLVLDAARDARVAFEAKPSGGCIGDHPTVGVPPTTTSSVSSVPSPSSSTTVQVRLHRGSTTSSTPSPSTTGRGSSSSSSSSSSTTSTTSTPLCDLIPDPITVPRGVPCL